ncbi:heavy metal translocating P-type ATPase [Sinorhizobium sp. BG8]|uniref:heavy metal translocating P-type ATPase n=1 Tax=Sinorhizobium sp. BG8 TaxID=2613773 RepID=UPI00193D5E96|nr:heavy metal translocating P-type ATPase [Sinorhizobium sp. BG8]QRM55899.1 cadmium-translocating P-type ATPase [Sinorhizobium sp. BG8]
MQTDLSVPGIHCGGCIHAIEEALCAVPGVVHARANLSSRSVAVQWRADGAVPDAFPALAALGYDAHIAEADRTESDGSLSSVLKALAVAAFASMNIMTLSISVWSGADGSSRVLLHWVSAAIALPALLYSGRIFYLSAWHSLRHGRTNMDVPITVGIVAAFLLSLYDTVRGNDHAYFDAATSLIFFLLIGRALDHVMRERTRTAVRGLARLSPRGALAVAPDGTRQYVALAAIEPGRRLLIAAGERVPVDCTVEAGTSDLDFSLVTGESLPRPARPGMRLQAGMLNVSGPLTVVSDAKAEDSFLAEMTRMMEAAESGRSAYRRLADRVSRHYAPVVHLAALSTFLAWIVIGGDLHQAATYAIAVLIITCPCALGLAVPMVQVIAARRLFENGIMVKDGSALERMIEIDHVVFDKTGTLTSGRLHLANTDEIDPKWLALAGMIAAHSRHPNAQALSIASGPLPAASFRFDTVREEPGHGIEARAGHDIFRLGRASWASPMPAGTRGAPEGTALAVNGELVASFAFRGSLRSGAAKAVAALADRGLPLEILSGDDPPEVGKVARQTSIPCFQGGMLPGDKLARISALARDGRKVLMVGDGLNDGPALMGAHVSMAPSTAADIGRNAADFVFLKDDLSAVPLAHAVARAAHRLIRQNIWIAIGYNAIALPIAIAGYATPLIAAVAMSVSSIIVVANATRLRDGGRSEDERQRTLPSVHTLLRGT